MTIEPLSELERTKMENFALKHNIMQQQLQQIVAERSAYIKQVEAAHPGCRWDEQRGLVKEELDPVTQLPRSENVLDVVHPN